MFTYHHENSPKPFNHGFIPGARDISMVAAAKTEKLGLDSREARAAAHRTFYDELIVTRPSEAEVLAAREYLYGKE